MATTTTVTRGRSSAIKATERSLSPVAWRLGRVAKLIDETGHAKSIVLEVPGWPGHIAGQHVDVRLTAEDGYQTERSYSIASAPEESTVELTVERIDDGEVSPYLTEELRVDDELELRGPFGGYFNWRETDGGPLLLIAGGSGVVPLMAMLRHRAATSSTVDAHLLLSARTLEDVLYRDELGQLEKEDGLAVHLTFTRYPPAGWGGFDRRIDAEMLATVGPAPARRPRIFICGPTAFVERAANLLVTLGHPPGAIRTERFGPTA
jgi:ferredoxin-NADP reductase